MCFEKGLARIESGVSPCAWHRRLNSFAIGGGAGILGEGGGNVWGSFKLIRCGVLVVWEFEHFILFCLMAMWFLGVAFIWGFSD